MLASIRVGFHCRTASPIQNTGWPTCPPIWLSGRDQWKSQIWRKACNRRDQAGDMAAAFGAKPAVTGSTVCAYGKLESGHCWRL